MLDRHDLTDEEWARLEPLLPDWPPRRGGRRTDHRALINGVLWRTRTGSPWRDLPSCYGNWKTVYNRHRRWSADGIWDEILPGLGRGCDQDEDREWALGVDSTVTRAHQHAAGARRRLPAELLPGGASNDKNSGADPRDVPDREALGRSRGGLTTKIHLVADSRSRPIDRFITAGQRHDSVAFEPVMAAVRIRRRGAGRPRTRQDRALADKAYSSKAIRAHLGRRGIRTTIPERADQQAHRGRRGNRGGRPPAFDPAPRPLRRSPVLRALPAAAQAPAPGRAEPRRQPDAPPSRRGTARAECLIRPPANDPALDLRTVLQCGQRLINMAKAGPPSPTSP